MYYIYIYIIIYIYIYTYTYKSMNNKHTKKKTMNTRSIERCKSLCHYAWKLGRPTLESRCITKSPISMGSNRWCHSDVCWFTPRRVPHLISTINQSEMGVIRTNLANDLGHHRVPLECRLVAAPGRLLGWWCHHGRRRRRRCRRGCLVGSKRTKNYQLKLDV